MNRSHYFVKDLDCECQGHYGQELVSIESGKTVNDCFDHLFGDQNQKLWIHAYREINMSGIFIGNWFKEDDVYKRTILYTCILKLPNCKNILI